MSTTIIVDQNLRRVLGRAIYGEEISGADAIKTIQLARQLNADPWQLDLPLWNVGKSYCRPTNPNCPNCYLRDHCVLLSAARWRGHSRIRVEAGGADFVARAADHLRRAASPIALRAAALIGRFFGAGFAAGALAAPVLDVALFFAAPIAAHLRFAASAIALRPAALMRRFFGARVRVPHRAGAVSLNIRSFPVPPEHSRIARSADRRC